MNLVLTYGKSARIFSMDLAVRIGLNEAIVLNQIDYWINVYEEKKDADHFQDGRWWVYNTIKEWQENFPCFCERTMYNILKNLRDLGVVETANYNKVGFDRTLWYTINYNKLMALIPNPNCTDCDTHNAEFASPIPKNNTKNTKDTYISASAEKENDDINEETNTGFGYFEAGDPEINKYLQVFQQELGKPIMAYAIDLEIIKKFIAAGLTPEEYRQAIREQKKTKYTVSTIKSTENFALNFKKPKHNSRHKQANPNLSNFSGIWNSQSRDAKVRLLKDMKARGILEPGDELEAIEVGLLEEENG
jgi:hypothetical protein